MQLLVFLGPPGVGKGTAAERIVTSLGFLWLSTGDRLREAQRSGSLFGQRVTEYMNSGRLVPDELIIELVESEIATLAPSTRLLLDGFPRTLPQAIALDENLARHANQVDLVIELQADQDELVRRIRGRSQTDGRTDDTLETLQHRLEEFHRQTAPLTEYYQSQGKLQVVDARGSLDEVFESVRLCIGEYLAVDGEDAPRHHD